MTEPLDDERLGDIRDRVLHEVRLFAGAPPFEPQHFDEQALGQPVTPYHLFRTRKSRRAQRDAFAGVDADEAVATQAREHARHRRRPDPQTLGDASGDHLLLLIMRQAVDGRESIVGRDVGDLLGHGISSPASSHGALTPSKRVAERRTMLRVVRAGSLARRGRIRGNGR